MSDMGYDLDLFNDDEPSGVIIDAVKAAEARAEGIARVLSPEIRQQRIEEIKPIARRLGREREIITTDDLYEYFDKERGIYLPDWVGNAKCLVGVWQPSSDWQALGYFRGQMVAHHMGPKVWWLYTGAGGHARVEETVPQTAKELLKLLEELEYYRGYLG